LLAQNSNPKLLLDFLISRWLLISGIAAMEKVYIASHKFASENDYPLPVKSPIIESQPCLQIEIIKQHIIEILPEAKFIDYVYEPQAPLDPEDFVEIYIEDHKQCADKVQSLMNRIQIT